MPYAGQADGRDYQLFRKSLTDPTVLEAAGKLYIKGGDDGATQLFFLSDDGTVTQLSPWGAGNVGFTSGRTVTASGLFQLADKGGIVYADSATPVVMTIPPHADVAFPLNTVLTLHQSNTGQASGVGDTGVNVDPETGYVAATRSQFSIISFVQREIDVWTVFGACAEPS